jgi:hypothetical protein
MAMKRLLWTIPMLFALISVNALADSVTYKITNANLYISPNYGGGGNLGFSMRGSGITLIGDGGTNVYFFDGTNGYLPGSAGPGSSSLFLWDVTSAKIGSTTYGFDDIQLDCCSAGFGGGGFTFPTNGKNFTIVMPASISLVSGTIVPDDQSFSLVFTPGRLTMSFYFAPDGRYYPSQATFVSAPEPGTLGLIGTGLAAVAGVLKRKSVRWKRMSHC